jgi:transposase
MIGRETRMLLRHYLEQGASKSALARQLGVSRDTLHRWIRDGELDRDLDTTPVRYGPRRPVPTKLDLYSTNRRFQRPPPRRPFRFLLPQGFSGSQKQLQRVRELLHAPRCRSRRHQV